MHTVGAFRSMVPVPDVLLHNVTMTRTRQVLNHSNLRRGSRRRPLWQSAQPTTRAFNPAAIYPKRLELRRAMSFWWECHVLLVLRWESSVGEYWGESEREMVKACVLVLELLN